MSAATEARRKTDKLVPSEFADHPMKAATTAYQNTIACLDAGYAKPGVTATGLFCLGRFRKNYDNSGGAAGAVTAEVEEGIFLFDNGDSIAQADVGKIAYIVDDQTVSKAGTGKSPAGIIEKVDAYGVYVRMSLELSRSLTTATGAVVPADLASTANGKGASTVGLEDAAAIFTATNVEAALAEVKALVDAGVALQKRTVTVGHADLTDADGSQAINIGAALPANARILGCNVKLATPFAGGGAAAVAVDIGTSGDVDALVDGADLFAAAVDGQASTMPDGISPNKHFSAAGAQLLATFTSDVNVADLTAGACTVEVTFAVLA